MQRIDKLFEKARTGHDAFLLNWSWAEVQKINNNPNNFSDLWSNHAELGPMAQIIYSISRTETAINECIRNYYRDNLSLSKSKLIVWIENIFLKHNNRNIIEKVKENKYFGGEIGLRAKERLLLKIVKKINNQRFKKFKQNLSNFIALRNIISHSELTYCNTRDSRYLIYRREKETLHILFEDYINELKEVLVELFSELIELHAITFKNINK